MTTIEHGVRRGPDIERKDDGRKKKHSGLKTAVQVGTAVAVAGAVGLAVWNSSRNNDEVVAPPIERATQTLTQAEIDQLTGTPTATQFPTETATALPVETATPLPPTETAMPTETEIPAAMKVAIKIGLPTENGEVYTETEIRGIKHLVDAEGNLMAVETWNKGEWTNLEAYRLALVDYLEKRGLSFYKAWNGGSMAEENNGGLLVTGFTAGAMLEYKGDGYDFGDRGRVFPVALVPIYFVDEDDKLQMTMSGTDYIWVDKDNMMHLFIVLNGVMSKPFPYDKLPSDWYDLTVDMRREVVKKGTLMVVPVWVQRERVEIIDELRPIASKFLDEVWLDGLKLGEYNKLTDAEFLYPFGDFAGWEDGSLDIGR